MEPPHFSQEILRPVARSPSPCLLSSSTRIESVTAAVAVPTSPTVLAGVQIKFTIRTSEILTERFATLGGIVHVDNRRYGLTTAHPVLSEYFQMNDCNSILSDPSSCSDSDPESDTDSELDLEDDVSVGPTVQSAPKTIWHSLMCPPKIMAYLGLGTTAGDWTFRESVPQTSDFALLDVDDVPHNLLPGYYREPGRESEQLKGHLVLEDHVEGIVHILAHSVKPLETGFLLPGSSSVILRGKIMRTRMIQITFAARK